MSRWVFLSFFLSSYILRFFPLICLIRFHWKNPSLENALAVFVLFFISLILSSLFSSANASFFPWKIVNRKYTFVEFECWCANAFYLAVIFYFHSIRKPKPKHDFILSSFLNLIKYNLSNANEMRCGFMKNKREQKHNKQVSKQASDDKVRAFKFVPWHKIMCLKRCVSLFFHSSWKLNVKRYFRFIEIYIHFPMEILKRVERNRNAF